MEPQVPDMNFDIFKNLIPTGMDINKLINDPNTATVECRTIFGPNTPIYVDGQVITMTSLHIGYSGKETKTLGINPTSQCMEKQGLLEIPKEVYVDSTVKISFGPGLEIECAPSCKILLEGDVGYKCVDDLKFGDKILVTKWHSETGVDYVEGEPVTGISKGGFISKIKTPMYAIITEYQNVFIPFYVKGSPLVWIINFQQ